MRNTQPRKIEVYENPNGQEPFSEWFASIQDTKTQPELEQDLTDLKRGIMEITNLSAAGSLKCVSILDKAIASTLVKWIE